MRYVQYYYDKDGKHDVLGDRGVVILDKRNTVQNSIHDAIDFNGFRRPSFKSFRLFEGESFSRSNAITDCIKLWCNGNN